MCCHYGWCWQLFGETCAGYVKASLISQVWVTRPWRKWWRNISFHKCRLLEEREPNHACGQLTRHNQSSGACSLTNLSSRPSLWSKYGFFQHGDIARGVLYYYVYILLEFQECSIWSDLLSFFLHMMMWPNDNLSCEQSLVICHWAW